MFHAKEKHTIHVTMQPYHSVIDKLIFVSKMFADQRVSELLAENKELKLQLFWKDHSTTKLKAAMSFANQKSGGPGCNCLACAVSGRKDENNGIEAAGFDCTFKPYFDSLLLEYGLVSMNCGGNWVSRPQHVSDDTPYSFVFDSNCHLVQMGRDDWFHFTYGARFWKAKSVCDPELLKLYNLFSKLEEDDNDSDGNE